MNLAFSEDIWKARIYRIYFILLVLQGSAALITLVSIPSDSRQALFWRLSWERLFLVGLLSAFVLTAGYLLIKVMRDSNWLRLLDQRLHAWLAYNQRWKKILFLCVLSVLAGGLYLLVISSQSFYILAPAEIMDPSFNEYFVNQAYLRLQPYLVRILPIVTLLIGTCAQTVILLPLAFFGVKAWHKQLKERNVYLMAGIYATLLILWQVVGWTQLKIEPDYVFTGWYPLGAPILDSQVLLTFLVGTGLATFGIFLTRVQKETSPGKNLAGMASRIDLVVALALWVFAALHWLSIPTQTSWFVAGPRYPNYQYYPNSDAYLYDSTAQSLLVGSGFEMGNREYARRPVYIMFLAGLYRLIGQDYETVTLVQSAIFAVFPVLIYWLTLTLHNRLSALIAALLVLFREGNAIALAERITVSNSRMFMAETPATIGVVLFACLVVWWLRQSGRRPVIALILGGVLGVFMQIRIEVAFLLPSFLLLAGFVTCRAPKQWLKNAVLISLGMCLFLAPWVWRNWHRTGLVFLERPAERLAFVAVRSQTGVGDLQTASAPAQDTLAAKINEASVFLRRMSSHYINSQAQAFLIFPDAFRLMDSTIGYLEQGKSPRFWKACCSRQDYIDRFTFWMWGKWEGAIPAQSVASIIINMLLVVIGLVKLWQWKRPAGIFLFIVSIGYYLATSAVRVSGGRFVQVVDWIWIVCFSVGLAQIIEWTVASLSSANLPTWLFGEVHQAQIGWQGTPIQAITPLRTYMGVSLAIILAGASLPLVEAIIQPRYTEAARQAWLAELQQSELLEQNYPDVLETLKNIRRYRLIVLHGRALYPRYYASGEGESSTKITPFTPRDFARFSFYLVGPRNIGVLLPLDEQPLVHFPNGEDVLVVGCMENGYLRALVVYLHSQDAVLISRPLPASMACQAGP